MGKGSNSYFFGYVKLNFLLNKTERTLADVSSKLVHFLSYVEFFSYFSALHTQSNQN